MFDDDHVLPVAYKDGADFAFIYCTRHGSRSGLYIYAAVVYGHVCKAWMGLYAELAADIAFLRRPWQTAFVFLESAGQQFFFFGLLLVGVFLHLFLYQVVYLAVKFVGFGLLFFLLRQQVFLFLLQVLQHALLLFLVACQVVLFAALHLQHTLLLLAVLAEQVVLFFHFRLFLFYLLCLHPAPYGHFLHITDASQHLVEVVG